ncbi:MAG: PIN domain-containing protein [Bacteroidales bacterium]|nr:PIN domain-containing protein [Bacteroidales bacterium]
MKKPKIYLDTSVFGGFFDKEFEEYTKPLFERIANGEFVLIFSDAVQDELEAAPQQVRDLATRLKPYNSQFVEASEEAKSLANEYVSEKVVGQTSFTDCVHIALATIHNVDYLISWNFKDIVNVQRIRGYNTINLKNGYPLLEIRSPREFAL